MEDFEFNKHPVLDMIQVLIEANYLSCEEIRDWATNAVSKFSAPRAWLLELACATSLKQAVEVVRQERNRPADPLKSGQISFYAEKSIALDVREQLLVGFAYLRYRRGDIGLRAFQDEILDISDPDYDREWGVDLLRQIFDDPGMGAEEIASKMESRYAGYGEKSSRAFDYVMNDLCLTENADLFEYRSKN